MTKEKVLETIGKREDSMDAQDWKTMYLFLMRAVSDVVDGEDRLGKAEIIDILTAASLKAEDYYINISDAALGWSEDRDHKNLG